MASTESATKLSGVLASLSETLGEFRAESEEMENEFFELVDEIAEFADGATGSDPEFDESTALTVERLENLDRSLAQQREEFADKQDQLSDDVGQLRDLVDQQVQLFAAWISSSTKPSGTPSRKRHRKKSAANDAKAEPRNERGAANEASSA